MKNCICLEISVINNDIVNPISFKIAVVSVLTLGFIRILSMPVLSILSKDISISFVVGAPYVFIVSEAFNVVWGLFVGAVIVECTWRLVFYL